MASEEQIFYWMKLPKEFFQSLRIKRLRKMENGDTSVVIYMKMMLISLANEGLIRYEGLEESFESEIALALDEDEEIVGYTIPRLVEIGLIEWNADKECFMKDVPEMISSKKASSVKRQEQRVAKRNSMLSLSDTDRDATMSQNCRTEIEKELEIDKEIDSECNKQETEFTFVSLVLKDGSFYPVSTRQILDYEKIYSKIDVKEEFGKMKSWCEANPNKRKSKQGIKRFIVNWLNNASEESSFSSKNDELDCYNLVLEKLERGGD